MPDEACACGDARRLHEDGLGPCVHNGCECEQFESSDGDWEEIADVPVAPV